MKNILTLLAVLFLFSCASKKDDPLVIPPNFSEMPDPNNPEKISPQQSEENVSKLKELLLKSDEE